MIPESLERNGILLADHYLGDRQIKTILKELEFAWWRRSSVVQRHGSGDLQVFESANRTSEGTDQRWFGPTLTQHVGRIEARLCRDFGLSRSLLEPWQAVRYHTGEHFGLHHDAGLFASETGGERVLSFVLCLKAPREGGATYFPDLDRLVDTRAGRLIVWNNLLPDGSVDPTKRHAATPAHRGRKVILTTWSRQRPIR
ncbi:prolyl hydroxylase family protein [Nocardia gipuzkoensis]